MAEKKRDRDLIVALAVGAGVFWWARRSKAAASEPGVLVIIPETTDARPSDTATFVETIEDRGYVITIWAEVADIEGTLFGQYHSTIRTTGGELVYHKARSGFWYNDPADRATARENELFHARAGVDALVA